MAITNAQQYQQLVRKDANGKRPGYRGGRDLGAGATGMGSGRSSRSSNVSPGAGNSRRNTGGGSTNREKGITQRYKGPQGTTGNISKIKTKPPERDTGLERKRIQTKKTLETFKEKKPEVKIPTAGPFKYLEKPIQKFSDFTAGKNRAFFEDVIRAGKIPGVNFAELEDEEDYEKAYQDYMSDRLAGRIDAYGNPIGDSYRDSQGNLMTRGGGQDQPIVPIVPTTTGSATTDVVDNRTDLEKLLDARGAAYRFFADGGRVPAQQGGIMPRLNELSGGVSSAEQMLQEINQRLDSAESTLGEGGGNTAPIGSGFMQPVSMNNPQAPDLRAIPEFMKDPSYQPIQGSLPGGPVSGGPIQSPIASAMRPFADGGRADDEEDYVGGIMDLETSRQMYGLGKLVKKVTRGVKKIAKSPLGKAALLGFAGNALMGGGLKSFLLGAKGPPGIAKTGILQKMFLKNPSLGFSLGNISPYAGIVGSSLFAGLMTPKEQEEEEAYLGPTIDIPGIRKNPYAAMGETYRFYADGGKAEPVAKKTMPLLDMDGMEKDYRADGGFVPIGRMERADDVPARLSKNEFVFTADAVRNAGDGDVDKGAEVMYNMMKNLEAGGNVSEESQGLDGARKMFQTSQRLEEVL